MLSGFFSSSVDLEQVVGHHLSDFDVFKLRFENSGGHSSAARAVVFDRGLRRSISGIADSDLQNFVGFDALCTTPIFFKNFACHNASPD